MVARYLFENVLDRATLTVVRLAAGVAALFRLAAAAHAQGPGRAPDATRIAFPTIVTPYGIAVATIILATSPSPTYTVAVIAILPGVMVLNLLAMLFARQILRTIGPMPLQILGAVLSILQIALGVQLILWALAMLGIVEGIRF
jgi:multiple antibiotic resistance protein